MSRTERVLIAVTSWASALMFLTATAWTGFSASEMPLKGLQELEDPVIGWPLTLITLVLSVFLSIPPLWKREHLLVCAGFCLCLFLVVALYAAPSGALGFALIAGSLLRESMPSKGNPAPSAKDRSA